VAVLSPTNAYLVFNNNGVIRVVDNNNYLLKTDNLTKVIGSAPLSQQTNVLPGSSALLFSNQTKSTWVLMQPNGSYKIMSPLVDSALNKNNLNTNQSLIISDQRVLYPFSQPNPQSTLNYQSLNLNNGLYSSVFNITPTASDYVFRPVGLSTNNKDIVVLLYQVKVDGYSIESTPAVALINTRTYAVDQLNYFPQLLTEQIDNSCGLSTCAKSSLGISQNGTTIVYCDNTTTLVKDNSVQNCSLTLYNFTNKKYSHISLPSNFTISNNETIPWLISPSDQYLALSGTVTADSKNTALTKNNVMDIYSIASGKLIKQDNFSTANNSPAKTSSSGYPISWIANNLLVYRHSYYSTNDKSKTVMAAPEYYVLNLSSLKVTTYPLKYGKYLYGFPANS